MSAPARPIVGAVPGMTIEESARRLGAAAWVEQQLFELLGGWVRSTDDPHLALALATTARHHGAHALELGDLLPETRAHDPAALVAPPPDDAERWKALGALDDPVAGVRALVEAVAGHLSALETWLAESTEVRDGPGIRVVARILAEDRADRDRLGALVG